LPSLKKNNTSYNITLASVFEGKTERQAARRYKQAATFRFQTSCVAHNLF